MSGGLYGFVCRRQPLWRLLWWGIGVAIFQWVPLLAVHDAPQALLAGALAGLLGGFATAATTDLLIRSCPEGLEGTAMMLFGSGAALVIGASNLCGTWLYTHGGFGLSVWATVAVYALMAPVLLLVPRSVVALREGEALTQT